MYDIENDDSLSYRVSHGHNPRGEYGQLAEKSLLPTHSFVPLFIIYYSH